jgi:hypothetical protein
MINAPDGLTRGEVIALVATLRRMLSDCYTVGHVLQRPFVDMNPKIEAEASALRPGVDKLADRIHGFLALFESHPDYLDARRTTLLQREKKD